MKRLIFTLAIAFCGFALGCNRATSSEGRIVRVVFWPLPKDASAEAIQEAEAAFRTIPSKVPSIERFEWGKVEQHERSRPASHVLLVTFKDAQSAFDRTYEEALRAAAGEGARVGLDTHVYQRRDATPNASSATSGQLRRVVLFSLKPNATPQDIQKIEDAMSRMPAEVDAIKRLEWGAQKIEIAYDPSKPKPKEPPFRGQRYCLLFTFEGAPERDACLSHPAYKDFQKLLDQYGGSSGGLDYVAQVE